MQMFAHDSPPSAMRPEPRSPHSMPLGLRSIQRIASRVTSNDGATIPASRRKASANDAPVIEADESRISSGLVGPLEFQEHRTGIEETDDLRLELVGIPIAGGQRPVARDLGPSPPANNHVKGLSLSLDGRTVATSMVRLRGDVWILSGLHRRSWFERQYLVRQSA